MKIWENALYQEDIASVAETGLPWDKLCNRVLLISGARGLIGSFLVDVLMYRNIRYGLNCKIYAAGRDEKKASQRFSDYWDSEWFEFIAGDINQPFEKDI